MNTGTGKTNRLIYEKSPYLLQHAYNPVNWFPWGEEAFEKAKKEDKPVFLSIGYSTCHWCHVMEKESFEDDEVASLMNDVFVSIKVDREERPDIDSIYMALCQAMTGSGGWPLNLILTPDKKPFHALTYIPKENRFGRTGMMGLIPQIKQLWDSHRDMVEDAAERNLNALDTGSSTGEKPGAAILHQTYEQILYLFDEEHGGFGIAPKFPTPHNLMFLLRYWKRTGNKIALIMVEKTLSAMRNGGIYDHIGFGFHRYSIDSGWLVPHFEKMLYDQAMLAMAYTEAYQATGKEEYKKTCREILTYVMRDMTSHEGGFYSGEDADSEGEEGRFYLWTTNEIRQVLSNEENEFITKIFNIKEKGNFQEGNVRNIFYLPAPEVSDLPDANNEKKIDSLRGKLFNARENRIHPGKDDKILTDWNGLMIAALAKASQAFDEPGLSKAAGKAADFILSKMHNEKRVLFHRYRDGETAISGFLDDYSFLIWGLLELYEATFDIHYLKAAIELNEDLLTYFWDKREGGFFITSEDVGNILVRKKDIYDGAVPSGNSVAMLNLVRLGRIKADPELERKAEAIEQAFSKVIEVAPAGYTMLMSALDFALGPSEEIVITGDLQADDIKNMLMALRTEFIPNKVVIFRPDEESEITRISEYTKNLSSMNGKATAYVCRNFNCILPVTEPGKMLELLHLR
ncbi:MAG: thioredoxin domain-containing protein [Candidatus Methanoperedenaceae archaeon]|nr:MAG: thioredoxin domain-containing protein [Candidatus Methanoperedenaceae archaeon]